MAKIVNICDVCSEIFAGGDAPKGNMSETKTEEYNIPIYANGEANEGLYGYTNKARVTKPSITVSARGTIGYTAIRPTPFVPIVRLITLTPNPELIDIKYLYYAAQNYKFDGSGTSIPQLTVPSLKKYSFPLPAMEEQAHIVMILDNVCDLIDQKKQQLELLDELVKSQFIELFGDPIRNTQNRPTTDFINVVKMQRGFDLPVQDRQQDGDIPVFGSNGALDRHNVAKVQGGGVITGRSGTIGKVYYTEGDYWPLNTSLFSVDTHGNNIIYLAYLLQMYDLSRFTEGTGVPTLNRNKFHDKPIIDVPLNEQEQFAVFVKQTDKSKLAIQQSLGKLELLKKSLMQEYFG